MSINIETSSWRIYYQVHYLLLFVLRITTNARNHIRQIAIQFNPEVNPYVENPNVFCLLITWAHLPVNAKLKAKQQLLHLGHSLPSVFLVWITFFGAT